MRVPNRINATVPEVCPDSFEECFRKTVAFPLTLATTITLRRSSSRSDSRQRLQSRLCLGRAQGFPAAVSAPVLEVGEVRILRREQLMLLGLGFRPRPGELLERGRFSASPEPHHDHPGDSAVLEPAGGQVAEQAHDTLVLLRVPAIVQAVATSEPRWRIL